MMDLYHYYDKRTGPFRSLTSKSTEDPEQLLEQIKKQRPDSMCANLVAFYKKKESVTPKAPTLNGHFRRGETIYVM